MTSPIPASSPIPPAAAEVDPLDCLDTPEMKVLLAKRASDFPTASADIDRFLESMPLMTTAIPSLDSDKSADLSAMEALAGEEKTEDRVEAFKQSGNEAWKLSLALKADADKAEALLSTAQQDRERGRTEGESEEEEKRLTALIARLEDKVQRQRAVYQRKLKDAYVYYSHAIDLDTFLPILSSSVLSNRALVSLTLQNYGHALSDARLAVKKDRNNAKAWYRGATALMRLGRVALAKDWVEGGLGCKRASKGELEALRKLQVEVETAEAAEKAKQQRREEERIVAAKAAEVQRQVEERDRALVTAALQERGLILGPALFTASDERKEDEDALPSSVESLSLSSTPSPYRGRIRLLDDGSLSFPLTFIYPQHQQSDHIEQHHELEPLRTSMEMLFPPSAPSPPWDERGDYRMGKVEVWVECEGKRGKGDGEGVMESGIQGVLRVRVDPELSLLSILTLPALKRRKYKVPGAAIFVVTVKGQ